MPSYNYGFPVTYTPVYPTYQQAAPVQSQQNYSQTQQNPNNGIIWVQGEAAAKAYSVPPNSQVILMDSEGECFYIKATDASGMPLPLRTFEYKEIVKTETPQESRSAQPQQSFDPDKYVSKEEFDNLKKQIQNMSRKDRNSNAKQSV